MVRSFELSDIEVVEKCHIFSEQSDKLIYHPFYISDIVLPIYGFRIDYGFLIDERLFLMLYRGQFQTDLDELQKSVLAMATSVSKLFQDSIEALHEQDKFRVETIINHDKKINEMEYAVIQKVNKLIAQQQPVASDLRRIIIAMKMANDLERMGDHGVNICKSILRMKHEPPNQVKSNINIMSDLAIKMLNISMASYENEDVRLAKQLKEMDEELDVLHRDNYMRISENIAQNKECSLETMMEFAFISRYIERFADHVTNIGENVFYLVKGERFDLNT